MPYFVQQDYMQIDQVHVYELSYNPNLHHESTDNIVLYFLGDVDFHQVLHLPKELQSDDAYYYYLKKMFESLEDVEFYVSQTYDLKLLLKTIILVVQKLLNVLIALIHLYQLDQL